MSVSNLFVQYFHIKNSLVGHNTLAVAQPGILKGVEPIPHPIPRCYTVCTLYSVSTVHW